MNNNFSQSVDNPPSSRQQQHSSATAVTAASSSSHLEAGGGSRSTLTTSTQSNSGTTTPTSSTAPPSTSAALDSAARPRHDVPDSISHQSYNSNNKDDNPASTSSQSPTAIQPPSSSSPTTSVVPASHRPATSMNPSFSSSATSVAFSHGPIASQPSQHLRHASSQQLQQGSYSSPASSRLRPTVQSSESVGGSGPSSPSRIKVRDLSHVRGFANAEFSAQQEKLQDLGQRPQERQYEISSMPTTDVIEMVAGLLTKITATNDVHHNDMRIPPPDGTANLSPQATSVLAFHGKNVPAISILSYLTRINKYCPTTYEVFISLLIYFDRMTDLVNRGHLDRVRHRWGGYNVAEPANKDNDQQKTSSEPGTKSTRPSHTSPIVTPPSSTGMTAQDPASPSISPSLRPQGEGEDFSHSFVVDSFNIHRLVIAGVTCASKFFSDVFYTNSRYAKVFVKHPIVHSSNTNRSRLVVFRWWN